MAVSNILVSIDLSRNNAQLIKFCFEIAQKVDARVTFLHCFHPGIQDQNLLEKELEKKHLYDLITEVGASSFNYEMVDFGCSAQSGFAAEVIVDAVSNDSYDMLILAASGSEQSLFGSGIAYDLVDKLAVPIIIVPDIFRLVDVDRLLFNLEFEFREIEKMYDLLVLCNLIGASLSCIHACNQAESVEAKCNIETYRRMFEGHILESMVDFELLVNDKVVSIEAYAIQKEVDLLVLGKTRKTWRNQYSRTLEQKLVSNMNIPIMLIDI